MNSETYRYMEIEAPDVLRQLPEITLDEAVATGMVRWDLPVDQFIGHFRGNHKSVTKGAFGHHGRRKP